MRGLVVLLIPLALAGCGGSKSSSSSSTPSTTAAPITPTETSTTSTTQTTRTTTSATTGAINVRVPARFTILASGSVSPPAVAIPAHLPVELIVVSNGQVHRVALGTTTLTVKPHGQVEKLIDGLKAGSYPLKVDGAPKAVLTIGANPGP